MCEPAPIFEFWFAKTEDKHITIGQRTHKNGKISSGEHQNDVQHK